MALLIPVITIFVYFIVLMLLSRVTSRDGSNDTFFRAGRRSPWFLVAFGMIGASVSGVSLVSVPGYVGQTQMTYLQMCLGFFFGYLFVAYVLLPLYYRNNLTSIYSYLHMRFGPVSHKMGASFFILSKATGAAVRFYLVCVVLQKLIFEPLGVPYVLTVVIVLLLIWLYTRRAGIRTLVYTDCFQTLCFLLALVAVIVLVGLRMYSSWSDMISSLSADPLSRIFVFDDWTDRQNFWKQFVSGIFIVVVMTGLDQDMMQKNLTCRSLKDAQKNMCLYGMSFVPVNLLLLVLGVMLYNVAAVYFPDQTISGDLLFPTLVQSGIFGYGVMVLFVLGISAAAFSSVDSALTALTTSVCIDILGMERGDCNFSNRRQIIKAERMRKRVHLSMVIAFVIFVVAFKAINNKSAIDAIYTLASYTYGPLLGLFAFAILTRRGIKERFMPMVAIASPLLCWAIAMLSQNLWEYRFGYELLMLNGMITFAGLYALSYPRHNVLPHP